jgi:hypothetical protein
MTDRELLELAAKAAGIELKWHHSGECAYARRNGEYWAVWNPLTDDGDALRLAVKLGITPHIDTSITEAQWAIPSVGRGGFELETHFDDPYAATRRAIVRAAAEIGRNMA